MVGKDTRTPVFIAALFTIAKTGKQPKYSSTGEWMKKTWYIHIMEYHSTVQRYEIMASPAIWMDLAIIVLSEVSQAEKAKYCMASVICGIQKEMIQVNLFTK